MSQAQLLSPTSPTVSLINGRPATTSLEVAKFFGKRHDHVVRDIRNLMDNCPEEFNAPNFGETFRPVDGPNGASREEALFILYFDGFVLLVMGYTGKKAMQIKLAYIVAFNAMRESLDKLAAEERALHCADVNPQSLPPAEQAQLHAIVAAKVGMLPKETQRKAYAEIWSRFGRHFQVAKYQQLPPARMGEAVEYLVGVELKATQKALPPAKPHHFFDRLGLTDWEKVQMGPSIRRMAEDERELGPKTVECILLKARYLKAIEDVHRLGNALFADLGKAENGTAKLVYQAVNKTGALADPFFDTLYDDRYRLVKMAGDFFDTACRALNSRICVARMMGL